MRNKRSILVAGLGGFVGSVIDVTLLVLLVEHGFPVAPAAFLCAMSGAGACFLINKFWAFRDGSPVSLRQVGTFGVVAVGSAVLMALGMAIVATGLGVPYLKAKAICAAMVFVAWSYPAQRRFVFRRPSPRTTRTTRIDPSQSLA